MVQVTIEYMIMVPLLIMQIFLFPLAVGWMMDNWAHSRQTLELQNTASHLGSQIQQIYFSLNHAAITAGTTTAAMEISPLIEGYPYNVSGTSRLTPDSDSVILDLNLTFINSMVSATTSITLGDNSTVAWKPSWFLSNSTAQIRAQKFSNGTIQISFFKPP
jgi:hypothetical protein